NLYFLVLAALLLLVFPVLLDAFRLNLVGKYLTYAFVAVGLVLCWGKGGILSLGQGVFFGLGGYCMAMFLKLEASSPEATASHSRLHGLESGHRTALVLAAVPQFLLHSDRGGDCAGDPRLHHRRGHVQTACRRRLLRHHYPGDRRHSHHPDYRAAGLYRRRQWHHRPAHADGLGHPRQ